MRQRFCSHTGGDVVPGGEVEPVPVGPIDPPGMEPVGPIDPPGGMDPVGVKDPPGGIDPVGEPEPEAEPEAPAPPVG